MRLDVVIKKVAAARGIALIEHRRQRAIQLTVGIGVVAHGEQVGRKGIHVVIADQRATEEIAERRIKTLDVRAVAAP